jgi:hypothetical protein
MEPDEIRVEIERRRKRGRDLRLRELLWSFYRSHLKYLAERLKKDPESVYPEIKETIKIANNDWQFRIGETSYRLVYEEKPAEKSRWEDETTTPMKFMLDVDAKRVFEFEMKRSITYTSDMPIFNESMGYIASFIEGHGSWTFPKLGKRQSCMRRGPGQTERSEGATEAARGYLKVRPLMLRSPIDLAA